MLAAASPEQRKRLRLDTQGTQADGESTGAAAYNYTSKGELEAPGARTAANRAMCPTRSLRPPSLSLSHLSFSLFLARSRSLVRSLSLSSSLRRSCSFARARNGSEEARARACAR
eukprot:1320387-Pleurochrysis_carterae.AAC.1